MPLQSVELVLDEASDAVVRRAWRSLAGVGLPSQDDHRGPTNAPHVTVAAVPVVRASAEARLRRSAARLPLTLHLQGPVLLGERRPALVLRVRREPALDDLHEHVLAALDATPALDAPPALDAAPALDALPWVPHVTLARRLPAQLAPRALALAESLDLPASVTATALRRWDPDRRQAWLLACVSGPRSARATTTGPVYVGWVKRLVATLAATLAALGLVLLSAGGPAAATPRATGAETAPASASRAGIPPVLRVGTEGVYTPFSYHDAQDRLTGFDIDVMNEIGRRLGVKVEYVETPWDSMFAALQAKRFDVVANQVTFNAERAGLYDLSTPYVETTGVLVVRKGSPIKALADLKGRKAAENLTSNWAGVAKGAGATIAPVDDMSLAIQNLEQGRVDAVVNDKLAIRNYLATNPRAGVEVVAETNDVSRSVLAARKGSGYLPQLDATIAAMKADGTLSTIYDKYFAVKPTPPSRWELVRNNAWPMLRAMVLTTIPLTAISFVIGLVLALGVGLARMSAQPLVAGAARFYISVIRGTPLLVQLFIIFYGLPEFGIRIDPFPAAVIAFSLNVGGYAAEIVRASIESLPRGQWEAASTIGMNHATTLRRIILPQAARTAVPPLSNTLISLLKDTSLAAVILVVEVLRTAQIAAAPTFQFFTMYAMAAVYYYLACLVLSFVQSRTEVRLNRYVAA